MDRARAAVEFAGAGAAELTAAAEGAAEKIAVGPMHLAKGLEFPAVAVMACDDEILPLQARIEAITDEPTSRRFLTPNGTSSMSLAPAPAIICMFRGSSRGPNFSLIFRRPVARQWVPPGNLERALASGTRTPRSAAYRPFVADCPGRSRP